MGRGAKAPRRPTLVWFPRRRTGRSAEGEGRPTKTNSQHRNERRQKVRSGTREMTRHIVAQTKRHDSDTVPGDFATLTVPCPKCGGVIKENYKKFQCQNCDFALWKIASGRQFEISEIEELISKGVAGPLQGFRSKMGSPFARLIRMTPEVKPEYHFVQGNAEVSAPAA